MLPSNLIYLVLSLAQLFLIDAKRSLNNKKYLLPSNHHHAEKILKNTNVTEDKRNTTNNNSKRWLEASYSQSYQPSNGDVNSLESQSLFDVKQDTAKQAPATDSYGLSYSSDIEAYLKPGIGDYPSDMPEGMMNSVYPSHQHRVESSSNTLLERFNAGHSSSSLQHGNSVSSLEDSLLVPETQNGAEKLDHQHNIQKFTAGENDEPNSATIVSDSINQDVVSPAKVIDSALTKIEVEAAKLINETDSIQHEESGSGVEENASLTQKQSGGDTSLKKSKDAEEIASFMKDDMKKESDNSPEGTSTTTVIAVNNDADGSGSDEIKPEVGEMKTTHRKPSVSHSHKIPMKQKEKFHQKLNDKPSHQKSNSLPSHQKLIDEPSHQKISSYNKEVSRVKSSFSQGDFKQRKNSTSNVKGSRRQDYTSFNGGVEDLGASLAENHIEEDIASEVPQSSQEVKANLMSSLKEALLDNVKDMMRNDGYAVDQRAKSFDPDGIPVEQVGSSDEQVESPIYQTGTPEMGYHSEGDQRELGEESHRMHYTEDTPSQDARDNYGNGGDKFHQKPEINQEKYKSGDEGKEEDKGKLKEKEKSKGKNVKIKAEEKQKMKAKHKAFKNDKKKEEKEGEEKGGSGKEGVKVNEGPEETSQNQHNDNKEANTEDTAAENGKPDLLEDNLMKIDKKKLVHLLAKFMRERKKSKEAEKNENAPHQMHLNPMLLQASHPTPSEHGQFVYMKELPSKAVPVDLASEESSEKNSGDVSSSANSSAADNDPYIDIGARDPKDDDKATQNRHLMAAKEEKDKEKEKAADQEQIKEGDEKKQNKPKIKHKETNDASVSTINNLSDNLDKELIDKIMGKESKGLSSKLLDVTSKYHLADDVESGFGSGDNDARAATASSKTEKDENIQKLIQRIRAKLQEKAKKKHTNNQKYNDVYAEIGSFISAKRDQEIVKKSSLRFKNKHRHAF